MVETETYKHVLEYYRQLEASVSIKHVENSVTYVSPVNFTESMTTARHRWFPYKEGFSPSFVKNFLSTYSNGAKGIVLDPFSGVGTTALTASNLGYSAVGFDVSPLATFVAQTKALQLNEDALIEFHDVIQDFIFDPLESSVDAPKNPTVIKYYDHEYLTALLHVKAYSESVPNKEVRALFRLAILSLVEFFSTHRKAGNGVKRKTKLGYGQCSLSAIEEVRQSVVELLNLYFSDIETSAPFKAPQFQNVSAISSGAFENLQEVSAVVTSPPYANCFDYSKIYMQELWLGDFFLTKDDQREFRRNSLRSHVHSTWASRNDHQGLAVVDNEITELIDAQDLWSNKISGMLSGYFKDIGRTLELLKPKLLPNAPVGFVVGNSFYGGVPIATDLLIGDLGRRCGYAFEEINCFRKIVPSSQQFKRIDDKYFMRESLVVLRNVG